jgi:hypothetical protein
VSRLPHTLSLLRSRALPSLSSLALVLPGLPPPTKAEIAHTLIYRGLLSQLTILQLHTDDYTLLCPELYQGRAQVLLSIEPSVHDEESSEVLRAILAAAPPYVRFFSRVTNLAALDDLLDEEPDTDPFSFLSTLANSSAPPSAILLPSFLELSASSPLNHPLRSFAILCETRRIDLVFYDEEEEEEYRLSEAFEEYVKQREGGNVVDVSRR